MSVTDWLEKFQERGELSKNDWEENELGAVCF